MYVHMYTCVYSSSSWQLGRNAFVVQKIRVTVLLVFFIQTNLLLILTFKKKLYIFMILKDKTWHYTIVYIYHMQFWVFKLCLSCLLAFKKLPKILIKFLVPAHDIPKLQWEKGYGRDTWDTCTPSRAITPIHSHSWHVGTLEESYLLLWEFS